MAGKEREAVTQAELQRWRDANADTPRLLPDLHERKIRNKTVKRLISMLTKNANEPDRIGRRVLVLNWLLQEEENVKPQSQKHLAQILGVSEGRVSQMLSAVEDGLEKIRKDGREKS